jgi:hypothetical protein
VRQSILKLFRRHARANADRLSATVPDDQRASVWTMVYEGIVDGHRRMRESMGSHRMRGKQTRYVRSKLPFTVTELERMAR